MLLSLFVFFICCCSSVFNSVVSNVYLLHNCVLTQLSWQALILLFCFSRLTYSLLSVVYRFGPRFPAMSGCYDKGLRCLAMEIAKEHGVASLMQEGVYAMVGGPNFETIAEARLLHRLGVDAVGTTHTQPFTQSATSPASVPLETAVFITATVNCNQIGKIKC